MKEKFTPGPWCIEGAIMNGEQIFNVCPNADFDDYRIAMVVDEAGRDSSVAHNAHLIAAAPDMYEALKGIIDSGELPYCDSSELVVSAKKALAKARGGL